MERAPAVSRLERAGGTRQTRGGTLQAAGPGFFGKAFGEGRVGLLAQLPQPLPFPLFCALLLVAPGWAFWRERGLTQQRDAEQAGLFIRELGVQPVARMARA